MWVSNGRKPRGGTVLLVLSFILVVDAVRILLPGQVGVLAPADFNEAITIVVAGVWSAELHGFARLPARLTATVTVLATGGIGWIIVAVGDLILDLGVV